LKFFEARQFSDANRVGTGSRHNCNVLSISHLHTQSHRMSKNDVSKAFNIFDPEGTGEISLNNLEEVAKQLGEDMTREELGEMLAMMQGKNKATREAFLSYMKQTGIY